MSSAELQSAGSALGYFWRGIVLKLSSCFEGQWLRNERGAAVPEHLSHLPSRVAQSRV